MPGYHLYWKIIQAKRFVRMIKLTFSEWVKKQLTVEEVEERLNKRKDSESYVAPLRNGGIVVLDKGTKW